MQDVDPHSGRALPRGAHTSHPYTRLAPTLRGLGSRGWEQVVPPLRVWEVGVGGEDKVTPPLQDLESWGVRTGGAAWSHVCRENAGGRGSHTLV